jgi:hypothetical protein
MLTMKRWLIASALSLAVLASALAGPLTTAVNSPQATLNNLTARAVPINATGDAATIAIPSYVTAYQVTAFKITNCSGTPVLATVGLFTGAGATGTTMVTASTITGATSASVVLSQTIASTARQTSSSLFVNIGVANVAAVTCDMKVSIDDLS